MRKLTYTLALLFVSLNLSWSQDVTAGFGKAQLSNNGANEINTVDLVTKEVATPSQRFEEKVDLVAIQKERNENQNRTTTFVVTKVEDTDDSTYDDDGDLIAHGCDSDDCSLREAVIASSNTPGLDTITFSSLFDTPQTIVLTLGQIEFGGFGGTGGNHIVIGPGEDLLTIDAQGNSRIFYMGFAHMLLELSNMTLANGNSATSSPYGAWGGAILNLGRADFNPDDGINYDITMTNVTIRNCVSNKGGGLSALRSQWLFENVTFDGNQGNIWGASFESEGGITVMNNCAVINNTTRDAMKVFASNFVSLDATLTMNNCTMSGNESDNNGSVIRATGQGANTAYAYINNSTITENSAIISSDGTAILFDGLAVIEAQNSIISGNTGGTSPDIRGGSLESTSSYNLIGTGGDLVNGLDGNIVGVNDPGLDALTNNGGTTSYHHPIANTASPAYNTGSATEATDQLGNPRGVYGADDIGAVELQQIDLLISIKAFLQGPATNPFTGEESLMRDDLRAFGNIPTTSPYTDALTCDASVFSTTGNDAIVDWVWIELRGASANGTVLGSRSALIQRDGDIVDVDGITTSLTMEDLLLGDYYVVVNHRTHLGIVSASSHSLTDSSTTSLDFTSDDTLINGGSNSVIDMSGTFAMYTGDFDGSGQVQSTDLNEVILLLGNSGYGEADMDMNGQIQTTDINLLLIPNLGKGQSF